MKCNIPTKILKVLQELESAGYEAFLVGGCVRDVLRGLKPKDWDITTNAKPKEILKVFPDAKYENNFGTVILPDKYIKDNNLDKLEILSRKIKFNPEIKDKLIEIARKYLKKVKCPAHGIKHATDVTDLALKISSKYKEIDRNLLVILSWFHDVGRAVGKPKVHIENSQKIIKKEFGNFLSKKEVNLLIEAVEHSHQKESIFLEQQILKEADIIDGLNVKRIKNFKTEEERKEHFNWIKNNFTNEDLYLVFKTNKGKELLKKVVKKFNSESFPIDLEMPNWGEGENIEITTYRIESTYSDNRHPDEVKFAKNLEEDLKRRDFTVNAMALKISLSNDIFRNEDKYSLDSSLSLTSDNWRVVDLFNGQQDLKNKVIRAVGEPDERFKEDALRMMRAVRFASQFSYGDDLNFLKQRKKVGYQNQKIEYQTLKNNKKDENNENLQMDQKTNDKIWWIGEKTFQSIKNNARLLKFISQERIRDEFEKIILSNRPAWGVELLVETGLMKYIIPEIYTTIGVKQNRHHYYGPFNTVFKHMLAALKTCPSKKIEVRLASFFHDIGKPKSKRGYGYNSTFYGHEYIGARMTKEIMERLKFPRKIIDKTVLLVKNHMFYYNVNEVGEKGVRKVVQKVGLENINDLIDVRIADRLGSGVAKAVPYKLRHFKYMVEKVSNDPISVKDLKINGDILIKDYNFKPSPQMGAILEILLAEVLDDPQKNTLDYLSKRAIELQKEDLQQLSQIAKNKIKEEKQKEEKQTKGKYWVK